jgi:soluble lytic murein transglycosylase-like protein
MPTSTTESESTSPQQTSYTAIPSVYVVGQAMDIAETYISDTAYEACVLYGDLYGIEPELLMAMIECESSGVPTATNGNCIGLMQVSSYWHADRMERLGCYDLYDTTQNIHVGADYMAELLDKYGNVYLALMVYNMGDSTALNLYEQGIYSNYSTGIVERAKELKELHNNYYNDL